MKKASFIGIGFIIGCSVGVFIAYHYFDGSDRIHPYASDTGTLGQEYSEYEYNNSNIFFDLIYPSLGLGKGYIHQPYYGGCMQESPSGKGMICDEVGALFDANKGGIVGVYFGGKHETKNINSIGDIDFLGMLTETGTNILIGDKIMINEYIINNRENIGGNTIDIHSGGRSLLRSWIKSQKDIPEESLPFFEKPMQADFDTAITFHTKEDQSLHTDRTNKVTTGLVAKFSLRNNISCSEDKNKSCTSKDSSPHCIFSFYTLGSTVHKDNTYNEEYMNKKQDLNKYTLFIQGKDESCISVIGQEGIAIEGTIIE